MFALSADTYTIRQKEIRKMTFLREQHSKTFLKVGHALHVESASNTLKKKDKAGLSHYLTSTTKFINSRSST